MRLKHHHISSLLAVLALSACPGEPEGPSFQLVEPTPSTTLDRCNIRVRTTPPLPDAVWGPGGSDLEIKEHVNWRIDGGRETEAIPMSANTTNRANFMFGVQLVEGAQTLELGRCDEFDICEWKDFPLTVTNAIGAPDCRAAHGGQQLFEHANVAGARALADGRIALIVAIEGTGSGLLVLKPDGAIDPTFGVQGVAAMPLLGSSVAAHPDGGFIVFGADYYLARVSAAGELDGAFGNAANTPGIRVIPCPVGEACLGLGLQEDGVGGFWMLAATGLTPGSAQLTPLLVQLDSTLAPTSYMVLDAGATATEYDYRAAAIDASGRAVFVTDTFAVAGSFAGVDTTFGSNGKLDLPEATRAPVGVAVDETRVVIARAVYAGNARTLEVRMVEGATARPVVTLPLAMDPTVADLGGVGVQIAADNNVYIAAARERPAEAFAYFPAGPGTEMFVARFADGVLDPSFGSQGTSTITFRDIWTPVSSESLYDLPRQLVLGADGAPWLVGTSSTFGTSVHPTTRRGPHTAVAKLRL